jgi:hypothetical protein
MSTIDLRRPTGSHREQGANGRCRTVFEYLCPLGHEVNVFASSFRGTTPEPSVGGIACPQCEYLAKYPQGAADVGQ